MRVAARGIGVAGRHRRPLHLVRRHPAPVLRQLARPMIDIFIISILVALVQLGELATIEPGVGDVCFAAVVIITIIAAMPFDPRLLWDAAGENHD
jgi:uncharacterized paraquat-inducible protein A